VTLAGFVASYLQKYHTEIAVRRVKGVAAVANDIQVKPLTAGLTDPQLARAALAALKTDLPLSWVDADQIKVETSGSEVTLNGEVRSWAERDQAQ
jgi:osmotically-inducible protein OsmY